MVSNLRKNFSCIAWHQKPTVIIEGFYIDSNLKMLIFVDDVDKTIRFNFNRLTAYYLNNSIFHFHFGIKIEL